MLLLLAEGVEVDALLLPLFRFLFLITSVFKLSGRTTPCNFRNKPHALQSGLPSGFLRHKGVVVVLQLVHCVVVAAVDLTDVCCLLEGGEGVDVGVMIVVCFVVGAAIVAGTAEVAVVDTAV